MVDVNGKPHAVGIDVARVLEYANPSKAVIQHCKGITKLGIPSEGGIQETNVIPEGDIYRLIVKAADQSQNNVIKDKAEKFGSWLFDEVLPSIRQGGSYSIQEATDTLPQIEVDMIATKYTIDILKPSEAGKINLISKVYQRHNIPTALLPQYTEEKLTYSATDLLKKFGAHISAAAFNKRLLQLGILEEKERPSTKGTKKFKCLTDKGMMFGKNLISPRNEKETQPHYFESAFNGLLNLIAN